MSEPDTNKRAQSPRPTVCYMCSSECGLLVSGDPSAGLRLAGNPASPMSRGGLCPKAALAESLRRFPGRLRTPLKRTGLRGEGLFRPASWEEALEDISRRLRVARELYGPESLTILFGEKPDHDMVYDFAAMYGTPNVLDHNSLCDTSRRYGFSRVFGDGQERPLPDLQRPLLTEEGVRSGHDCRLLVLFGENPAEARRFFWLWDGILGARRSGMRLIVADPLRTPAAREADLWLPVLPGEDWALIMAVLRRLLETGAGMDRDFMEKHTKRFEELRQLVVTERRDPENGLVLHGVPWAAARTGLQEESVEELVHAMTSIHPAAAMVGMNEVAHHRSGYLAAQALALVMALTGNVDVPGGLMLRNRDPLNRPAKRLAANLGEQAYRHKDVYGAYPEAGQGVVQRIPKDILEGVSLTKGPFAGGKYVTKSLLAVHTNPLLTAPESALWRKALTERDRDTPEEYRLGLFVVNATLMNETARYADWVLPMAHFLERQGVVWQETGNPVFALREAVAEPPAGVLSPLVLWKALASATFPGKKPRGTLAAENDDAWCNAVLAPLAEYFGGVPACAWLRAHGGFLSLPAAYRKYEKTGFVLGESRIDLMPEALRRYRDELRGTPPAGSVSGKTFRLISGRSPWQTHTITQDLYQAGDARRRVTMLINDRDAEELGLQSGDKAVVSGTKGSIRVILETSADLRRGVLRGQYGWGTSAGLLRFSLEGSYNLNELTDADALDPATGDACFGDLRVTIRREK